MALVFQRKIYSRGRLVWLLPAVNLKNITWLQDLENCPRIGGLLFWISWICFIRRRPAERHVRDQLK